MLNLAINLTSTYSTNVPINWHLAFFPVPLAWVDLLASVLLPAVAPLRLRRGRRLPEPAGNRIKEPGEAELGE